MFLDLPCLFEGVIEPMNALKKLSSDKGLTDDQVMEYAQQIEERGFIVLPSGWSEKFIEEVRNALDLACEACDKIQTANNVGLLNHEKTLSGAAHHLLPFSDTFVQLLEQELYFPIIERYLGGKVILNNAGGFINLGEDVYGHALSIHRDVRTVDDDYGKQMLLVLITLDDFTEDNGATYLLPGSHLVREKPDEDYFLTHAVRAIAPKGSLVIFDARLWHSAGFNCTELPRRAITYGFTRPFFKQQFDYCRALGWNKVEQMTENLQQLLGFYSRVPSSHDEWYQPIDRRFYRRDQG